MVVLACGKTRPRMLEIPHEETCQKIVYDVPCLKARLVADIENGEGYTRYGLDPIKKIDYSNIRADPRTL